MKDNDARDLLGGFAAGILTDREREQLFTAALHDQKLFDALADEEVLRELLADSASRRQLLRAIEPAKPVVWDRLTGWIQWPAYWAIAGSVIAALVVGVALHREKAPPVEMAKSQARPDGVAPIATRSEPQPTPPLIAPPKQAELSRRAMHATSPVRAAGGQPPGKMKVAILDFNSPASPEKDASVGKTASDLLTKKLDSSGYNVIDKKQVDQALQEQNLTAGQLDAASAASVGRSVGADAVIVGSVQLAPPAAKPEISKKESEPVRGVGAQEPAPPTVSVEITATAINPQTADNLAVASSQSGQSQGGSLAGAVNQVARSLGQQFRQKSQNQKSQNKLTGTVTGVTARFLTLDLSAKSGLKVDDRLEVRRDSKLVGTVVITSVKDSLSVGEFRGDGEPKVGDIVVSQ